ncbi:MAG: hypothetical protein WEE20_14860 [Bacteroidota bacterium]
MKIFPLVLLAVVFFTSDLLAQQVRSGFYVGGSFSALMMNGSGEYKNDDIEVTDKFFNMTTSETQFRTSVNFEYPGGWAWSNKILYGFSPVVGYRILPELALEGTYTYFMTKDGEQDQTFTSVYVQGLRIAKTFEMEYTQSLVRVIGVYSPEMLSGAFLSAGVEFASIAAELEDFTSVVQPGFVTNSDTWRAEGDDSVIGFVLGGGFEMPLASTNLSVVGSVLYSFTKYNGDDLLKITQSGGPVSDPNIDMELGIGGISGSVGFRWYFGSGIVP